MSLTCQKFIRLLQIFAARIVLEVFGGAGAIWGFSEAVGLRVPDNLWFWRPTALTFGAIFFLRWMMQIQDYVSKAIDQNQSTGTLSGCHKFVRLLQIFSARLVLEVFGGAGAIWGFSEAVGFRVPSTVWFWRPTALVFGFIFFIRWILQMVDFILDKPVLSPKFSRLMQIFSARLVLEVFGGGGAIWGFSEAICFRNPGTVWFWRPSALTVGVIFFVRWVMQIQDYTADKNIDESIEKGTKIGLTWTHFVRLIQIFSARLVLEVFGGAGAIWGFSEAIGFRVPSTVWLWKPTALTFGFIFFIRWIMQIHDYVVDATKQGTKNVHQKVTRLFQIFSAKLVLEVFGGAGAIWGFSEAAGYRIPSTVWFWRPAALTVGFIFFIRWVMQILDFIFERTVIAPKMQRSLQIFSAKLVLEVFGGGGAIWGFSEALGYRIPSTVWFWRPAALTFGALFFLRFIMQIGDFISDRNIDEFIMEGKIKDLTRQQFIRLLQIFSAKLVLEVFGGAGAIWGFSEAVGYRIPSTVWFWRPAALTVGIIFFIRWNMQIEDYIFDVATKTSDSLKEGSSVGTNPSSEYLDLDSETRERYGATANDDDETTPLTKSIRGLAPQSTVTSRSYDLNPDLYNLDPNLDPEAPTSTSSNSSSNLDPDANETTPLSISSNSLSV